jgi:hypothetical protein
VRMKNRSIDFPPGHDASLTHGYIRRLGASASS